MPAEHIQLESGIAALESQRPVLGDAVVDAALAGLRSRLAALRAAPPSEREPAQSLRQVSVLFLDVVGSTVLSQRLDPEEISAVMDGILRRSTVIVQAHGGRVLQYAGDSILAAFGTSGAAEDDAERAVRCGLGLVQLGRALAAEVQAVHDHAGCDVRVGIHTGNVLVGGGGGGAGDESAIRGLAVNIAARMEQTAPAGALRISRDTYLHVRGMFDVVAQDPLAVKGIDEPIVSYLVIKSRPKDFRTRSRGVEGVATRMVGRDPEFRELQDAFERLVAERAPLIVSVVGEAGIGKSRLLDEFQAWIRDRPVTVNLFSGRATPGTQGQPFALLRDIVAGWLQLSDDDTLDAVKAKIEQGLMPLFADEPELAEARAHLLGHLIGVDWKDSPHLRGIVDDPRQIRHRAQHAAALMFRRVSAKDGALVIMQIEDAHWADDESLDFLASLPEVNDDVPMLLLAFTRPLLFERRADWARFAGRHRRIDLHPLEKGASQELATELLRRLPEVPDALRALLTSGAEGNPFYMEELVCMLIDRGAIDITDAAWRLDAQRLLGTQVPSTLTGVLQARLDGLPADERLTLQEASVIGQIFWDRALLALDDLSERTLPRLVQRELALPRQNAQPDGLREYAFRHAILHQVTYDTVLRSQRKVLHAKLASWLAAQCQSGSARAGDFLGLTAEHYAGAGDTANAAEFHARAAEHAADRLAHAVALRQVGQALALLDAAGSQPSQAPMRWRLLRARERTLEIQGERGQQADDLDAMGRIAETLGDSGRLAYVAYRRALRGNHLAQWAASELSARRAVVLVDAVLAMQAGRQTSAEADDGLQELRLTSARMMGTALVMQDKWDEAEAVLQQTLDQARARELVRVQGFCLSSLSLLADRRDDRVQALAFGCDALDLFRQVGDRRSEAIALGMVGSARLDLGDLAAARRDLEEGMRLRRQNGERLAECVPLCNLSTLSLWQGDDAGALSLARSALDAAVAAQAKNWEVVAEINLGDAEAAMGRAAPAAQAYRRARSSPQECSVGRHFDASAGLMRLALAQGDIGGALDELRWLLTRASAGPGADPGDSRVVPSEHGSGKDDLALVDAGFRFDGAMWPRLVELTIHRVLVAARDPRADAWLERAYCTLSAQAEAISDAAMRRRFLSDIPHHREILSLRDGGHIH